MNITTKLGDDGLTQVAPDRRVSKGAVEVEFLGSVDELQVALGAIRLDNAEVAQMLTTIQKDLFMVASMIYNHSNRQAVDDKVEELEKWQATITRWMRIEYDWHLTTPETMYVDEARVRARRAERQIVRCFEHMEIGEDARCAQKYLNRLSDLLWIIGRMVKPKPYHARKEGKRDGDRRLDEGY